MRVVIVLVMIVVLVAMFCVMTLGQGEVFPWDATSTADALTPTISGDWNPSVQSTLDFATEYARQTAEGFLDVPPVVATWEAQYPTPTQERNDAPPVESSALEGFWLRVVRQILARWD